MDTVTLVIAVAVLVLVVLGVAAVALTRRPPPPLAPPTYAEPGEVPPTGDVTVLPPEPVEEELLLEKPEPVAGRMARLRARLSGRTIGGGLMGLLSRDKLDEETW